ncbi:MAG: peptidyl-alpha-hydroxyglycine alpha-amidating lyase family protein [Vicinamibacterales bacterium]
MPRRLSLETASLAGLAMLVATAAAPMASRPAPIETAPNQALEAQTTALQALVASASPLALDRGDLTVVAPYDGFALGMVSWVANDGKGVTYLLQRGDKADPVIALDQTGHVLRSWGKGLYTMPHAIRVSPDGHVWTTDAATSMVYEFTPDGRKLTEIRVGGQPSPCRGNFCSTTDIAFAPNGHLYISDGYANARVLEYTRDGTKVREWGRPGEGSGEFNLPHSIQIDAEGRVYVADRENGRVQRFTSEGRYIDEWRTFGKTFSLVAAPGVMWLATQPRSLPNLSPGWLMKVDAVSGRLLGYVEVTGVHGMDVLPNGELVVGPGPGAAAPQWFRRPATPR